MPTLVLASASPARRTLLRNAGIEPVVVVSDVDEDAIEAAMPHATPAELCLALARAKAEVVAPQFTGDPDVIVVGCDSVFDVDGTALGKPGTEAVARERWSLVTGRAGVLRTGHWVVVPATRAAVGAVADTVVHMGHLTAREMDAYLASGEPLHVAGGFTLDALGGAFVERVDGDPSNVVGLSLPTLRRLLADLGITWTDLWNVPSAES